jgi:hypothetical protein
MVTASEKKRLQTQVKKLRDEIEKKHGKTVDQLRLERDKRINNALRLKIPDRVPVTIQTGVFAARYAGIPLSAMYYDHNAYREASLKTVLDLSRTPAPIWCW